MHGFKQAAVLGTVAVMLAACGGGSDIESSAGSSGGGGGASATLSPKVTVDDLATGAYAVSTGDADMPTVGRYYSGADGRRLLALEDGNTAVDRMLRRTDAAASWVAVPAPAADLNVALLRNQARTLATPAAAALAGRYVVRLANGSAADFVISADGAIKAGTLGGCQLTGALDASALPGTLSLKLQSSGCAGLPTSASGVLVTDTLDAPASLRLLADDGGSTVDLRGYAEPAA